eukprot:TRINITY_DN69379_c0_g1_i1.p1 TRINITY_DN69379_c0_g1~~TRINITY_DN69379_c0_g1_i1.p1  ORF type:complete len:170 (-),score=28.05 TRINITY_DN69379_c0_g1_i1:26-535(-)
MPPKATEQAHAAVPMATRTLGQPRQEHASIPMPSDRSAESGFRQPFTSAGVERNRFGRCEFLSSSEPGVIRVLFPDGRIEECENTSPVDDSSSDSSSSSEAASDSSAELMRRFLAMPEREFFDGTMPEREFFGDTMLEDSDVLSDAPTRAGSSPVSDLRTLTDDEEYTP